MFKPIVIAASAAVVSIATSGASLADGPGPKYGYAQPFDPFRNFQVKVGATGVLWNDKNDGVFLNGAPVAGADAHVGDVLLPTATLTYYFNKNLAAELFCCFARPSVFGDGSLRTALGQDKLATTWAFPPIVTLQYHFDKIGAIRPYVGAGVEYIHYFSSKSEMTGALAGFNSVKLSDSWGPVVQVGFDYELGGGWSLGFDAKYVWESTRLTWSDGAGSTITTKHGLDPLLLTVNLGYRFNLEDLLGRRTSYAPLK